jgi:Amt family ammonium transporter
LGLLRVSNDGEREGLDLDQHGNTAYPEYVISTLTAAHGIGSAAAEKATAGEVAPAE